MRARLYRNRCLPRICEYFRDGAGTEFLREVRSYLKRSFGSYVYFDHITDDQAELMYRLNHVATLVHDRRKSVIEIIPYDDTLQTRKFHDSDTYSMNGYLSDLILGDVEE